MTAVAKWRAQECSSERLYYFCPKYPCSSHSISCRCRGQLWAADRGKESHRPAPGVTSWCVSFGSPQPALPTPRPQVLRHIHLRQGLEAPDGRWGGGRGESGSETDPGISKLIKEAPSHTVTSYPLPPTPAPPPGSVPGPQRPPVAGCQQKSRSEPEKEFLAEGSTLWQKRAADGWGPLLGAFLPSSSVLS